MTASFRWGVALETLRKSGRPLSTRDITDAVMKERGLDTADLQLHRLMQQRVGACCNQWKRKRGILKSTTGPGGMLYWEIALERPLLAGR